MSPLTKIRAPWLLVKQWAADSISFLELEKQLSSLGTYDYSEWKEIFKKVEVASDPTEEHPISAVDIVIEEARMHGISLLDQTTSPTTTDPSSSVPGCSRRPRAPSEEPRQSRKRRKVNASIFLDLDAEDKGDTDFESDDEIAMSLPRLRSVGRSGLQSLANNLDDIVNRYGTDARPSKVNRCGIDVYPSTALSESRDQRCYYIDFYSPHTARFVQEDLKPRLPGAMIFSWLPRRLYVQASCPLEVRCAINPSHRDTVRDIILVPPAEASRIFNPEHNLSSRSWVRIRRGKYKNDLGYVLNCDGDTVFVLVVPRERAYDPPEGPRNVRALFDWQTGYDAGLNLTLIENSRDITAFRCNDTSYFAGLLRLALTSDDIERVFMPHPEEIQLHAYAGVDPPFVEETFILFSSQFWIEGDVVRSSSPELLGQRATVGSVDFGNRHVSLWLDNETYTCPILEQRRVFSVGDHLRIVIGPNRGFMGMVTSVLEDEIVLCSSNDLTREIRVSTYYVETCHPGIRLLSNAPSLSLHPPPSYPEQTGPQPGDAARVVVGLHRGLCGYVDSIADDLVWITVPNDLNDDQPEDLDFAGLGPTVACVRISSIISTPVPNTLKLTKEKGYDVGVGDIVRIARGHYWGRHGMVNKVHWNKGRLELMLQDGVVTNVPITSCVKFADFSMREASKWVGKEVWIVGGEFKARRATLDALGRNQSVVSMYGHPALNVQNHHIAAPSGALLSGHMLGPGCMQALMRLIRRSFVLVPKLRNKTPPPSPQASSSALPSTSEELAWVITPSDLQPTSTQPPDPHGNIPWFFNDAFCDFANYHLAFNVSLSFESGAFLHRVARTTCPDRFCGGVGPAPADCVSVTVPPHNKGRAVEHHNIPARFLTPALPIGSGADRYGLILIGERAGQIHPITKYRRKQRQVQLDGSWFSCGEICPAYPYQR